MGLYDGCLGKPDLPRCTALRYRLHSRGNPGVTTDAIIALTHFDIVAPFGIGTCWSGVLSIATASYKPLQKALGFRLD